MKYTYQTDGPRGPPAFYWRKNMKHILSCSFGKDSIATALLALQHGEPLDELVYCEVMFNEEISGELPEHNRFIHETAIPLFCFSSITKYNGSVASGIRLLFCSI